MILYENDKHLTKAYKKHDGIVTEIKPTDNTFYYKGQRVVMVDVTYIAKTADGEKVEKHSKECMKGE